MAEGQLLVHIDTRNGLASHVLASYCNNRASHLSSPVQGSQKAIVGDVDAERIISVSAQVVFHDHVVRPFEPCGGEQACTIASGTFCIETHEGVLCFGFLLIRGWQRHQLLLSASLWDAGIASLARSRAHPWSWSPHGYIHASKHMITYTSTKDKEILASSPIKY
ncbi:hypothetical protein H3U93_01260 [Bifidobacterium sp. W8115]|nr:hypothetical protein [Bifidobacterium apousia]